MKPKTIEEEWNEFRKAIFGGVKLSEEQHTQLRKAFIAGAFTMYTALRKMAALNASQEDIIAQSKAYEAEFLTFFGNLLLDSVTEMAEEDHKSAQAYKNN